MNDDGTCTVAADVAAERSGLYALLAQAFSHPNDDVVAFLRRCADGAGPAEGELAERTAALLAMVGSADPEEMRATYMRVFDPVVGPFPYEAEYGKARDFQKAHLLADIMGFYRAFGVTPSGDRPDHIAAELEFMHLITLKEHHALQQGNAEHAEICREAQAKFLNEHLLKWNKDVADVVRQSAKRSGSALYAALGELLELFTESEREGLT